VDPHKVFSLEVCGSTTTEHREPPATPLSTIHSFEMSYAMLSRDEGAGSQIGTYENWRKRSDLNSELCPDVDSASSCMFDKIRQTCPIFYFSSYMPNGEIRKEQTNIFHHESCTYRIVKTVDQRHRTEMLFSNRWQTSRRNNA